MLFVDAFSYQILLEFILKQNIQPECTIRALDTDFLLFFLRFRSNEKRSKSVPLPLYALFFARSVTGLVTDLFLCPCPDCTQQKGRGL